MAATLRQAKVGLLRQYFISHRKHAPASFCTPQNQAMHTTPSHPALNQFGVDLLPEEYNNILFKDIKTTPVASSVIDSSLSDLEKFGLTDADSAHVKVPELTNLLPPLKGKNVLEHFDNIAKDQISPYIDILNPLLELQPAELPTDFRLEAGWVRYGFDGSIQKVDYPTESALVFDVEVSVLTDQRAVMAGCLSDKAWYTWLSPHLLHKDNPFPAKVTPDTMIPLGSNAKAAKLIIGHNVSYDRIRVGDEYGLDLTRTRYLDTMSLHIAHSGMTSSQRLLKIGEKSIENSKRPKWLERTSLSNLADIHNHYCKPDTKIDKDVRNSFVKLSLAELREDIPNLLTYCLKDVKATLEVVQVLVPKFVANCSHPASLSGMLTMSTSYLPTNGAWDRYIQSSDDAFERTKNELQSLLEKEVWDSLSLFESEAYRNDPWLWDLDWSCASLRSKKRKLLEALLLQQDKQLMANYPAWLQDIVVTQLDDSGNQSPKLSISTSKQFVPKILRLKWKGYPLHYHKKYKWGYLAPRNDIKDVLEAVNAGEIETDFPLEEYMECVNGESADGYKHDTDVFIDETRDYSDIGVFKKNSTETLDTKSGIDIDIPGVMFFKLPHKNGPTHNVGSPLSKDFLSACSEGGSLTSKTKNLAGELLRLNSLMVYWRNSRDRLMEQVKVDVPNEGHSAILPSLVVCGTVTRRAVEKTWLTASNAKETRIGSELKAAIRSPTGYHFVGADVDSQELWLASVLGDCERGGHGSTPIGWMSLQGEKSKGTDLHSKTAAAAQVTRDQAKVLNYARIYGAGESFAKQLLKQYNPVLNDAEIASRARHMYEQTKGLSGYQLNEKGKWLYEFLMPEVKYKGEMVSKKEMNMLTKKMVFLNRVIKGSKFVKHKDRTILCHTLNDVGKGLYLDYKYNSSYENKTIMLDDNRLRQFFDHLQEKYDDNSALDRDVANSLIHQTIWFGGTESHTFNKLESIAMSKYPKTPVLDVGISRVLETRLIGRHYLPSRINWVVQSTAVDFLHLLLVSMEWLMQEFGIKGRYCISIHDEVRYLVKSEDRYKAALALHLSNLLVRAHVVARLGLNNLPASIAYFSSVDVDTVLRKEPDSDCVTPSNPLGLAKGHGIPPGEGLHIFDTLEKLADARNSKASAEKVT
eukprot:TRINITY_DN1683_c0_g1_i7.p1 TRINITY_DN1683_c0_g1~~TRINITY_DN1683_c0_g1_i7.p1  ORF type:complete len:1146 (-),score=216.92 TRINITY_DN1683_c0_g1_i7:47-3484(-)